MTQAQLEIQMVAVMTAVACAIPGVFLVLRRMTFLSDAISHTVLLGIVIAYFFTRDLASAWLIAGAAITGICTVFLVDSLQRTNLVREDAAIGLVFPCLFSIAVILISVFFRNVHLDLDAVLVGKIALAPLPARRLEWMGYDLGPKILAWLTMVAILNATLVFLLYKELQVSTFDPGFARAMGFSPFLIQLGLISSVSTTAVTAFDAVGSILVVALMSGPAASAYLLTNRLWKMILLSVALGMASAILGYWVARWLDVSIAGSMAGATGLLFTLCILFAPEKGWISQWQQSKSRKRKVQIALLLVHLIQHENTPREAEECDVNNLHQHLKWSRDETTGVASRAISKGLATLDHGMLKLTPKGKKLAFDSTQLGSILPG